MCSPGTLAMGILLRMCNLGLSVTKRLIQLRRRQDLVETLGPVHNPTGQGEVAIDLWISDGTDQKILDRHGLQAYP